MQEATLCRIQVVIITKNSFYMLRLSLWKRASGYVADEHGIDCASLQAKINKMHRTTLEPTQQSASRAATANHFSSASCASERWRCVAVKQRKKKKALTHTPPASLTHVHMSAPRLSFSLFFFCFAYVNDSSWKKKKKLMWYPHHRKSKPHIKKATTTTVKIIKQTYDNNENNNNKRKEKHTWRGISTTCAARSASCAACSPSNEGC